MKPRISQLDQSGATNGQVPTWNNSTGEWEPATPTAGYSDEQARDAIGAALVAGSGITITVNDPADTITVAATGGGSSLTVQDENSNVSTSVTQIDFQGAGVTATSGSGEVVVTIPGASSGYTPTVRASAIGTHPNGTNTVSVTIPSSTVGGDLLILWSADHYDAGVPSGWKTLDRQTGGNMNGFLAYKYAISTDASSSVTVTLGGSEQGVLVCLVIQGPPISNPVEQMDNVRTTNGGSSQAMKTLWGHVDALVLGLFGVRGGTSMAATTGTTVLTNTTTDVGTLVVQRVVTSAGDAAETFSSSGSPNGDYCSHLIIHP